jgi:hypothetical protein
VNKPRNTIRAYRGNLTASAACHGGQIGELSAAPVLAFLGEIAGRTPAIRRRKRAAVASFCKWAVRHELLDASPMDRIDTIEAPGRCPARRPSPTSRRCWMRSAPSQTPGLASTSSARRRATGQRGQVLPRVQDDGFNPSLAPARRGLRARPCRRPTSD